MNDNMLKHCSYCDRDLPRDAFYAATLARNEGPCKECVKVRMSRRYKALIGAGLCMDCRKKVGKGHSRCPNCMKIQRERYHKNGDRERQLSRERHFKDKVAAFEAYGGPVCKCCGETELEFLSIDHINGDGAAHRKEMAKNSNSSPHAYCGYHLHTWLRLNNYPPGFQVLCMNCNFAKGHFGECPHQRQRLQVVK